MEPALIREIAVIDVDGMNCERCVAQVRHALQQVTGVERVDVSLDTMEAQVVYQAGQVSIARLMAAVDATGYHALGFTRGRLA